MSLLLSSKMAQSEVSTPVDNAGKKSGDIDSRRGLAIEEVLIFLGANLTLDANFVFLALLRRGGKVRAAFS